MSGLLLDDHVTMATNSCEVTKTIDEGVRRWLGVDLNDQTSAWHPDHIGQCGAVLRHDHAGVGEQGDLIG